MAGSAKKERSILKPLKPRNPLSEIYVEESGDVTVQNVVLTPSRQSLRRVSFASSNFVKEFVNDPEKNTIWNITYEETVKSDSNHSSEFVKNSSSNTPHIEECTLASSPNLKGVTVIFNGTVGDIETDSSTCMDGQIIENKILSNQLKQDVDCNNDSDNSNFSNLCVSNNLEGTISFTKQLPTNIVLGGKRITTHQYSNKQNDTILSKDGPQNKTCMDSNMSLSSNICANSNNNEDYDMSITKAVPVNIYEQLTKNKFINNDVSMVEQLRDSYEDISVKDCSTNLMISPKTHNFDDSNTMLFTKQLPTTILVHNSRKRKACHMPFMASTITTDPIPSSAVVEGENMFERQGSPEPMDVDCTLFSSIKKSPYNTPVKVTKVFGGLTENSNLNIIPQVVDNKTKMETNCIGMKKIETSPISLYQMNTQMFGPCMDDTQQLINYSLTHKHNDKESDFTKIIAGDFNPSFSSSKFMPLSNFGSDAFPIFLEPPLISNQAHLTEHDIKQNASKEVENEGGMYANIEASREKTAIEEEYYSNVENISQEEINFYISPARINNSFSKVAINLRMAKMVLQPKILEEDDDYAEVILELLDITQKKLDTSEKLCEEGLELMRMVVKPKISVHFTNFSATDDSAESSVGEQEHATLKEDEKLFLSVRNSMNTKTETDLNLQEKIQAKQKSCQEYWNLLSVSDNSCEFNTLFKTVRVVLQMTEDTGIVNELDVSSTISESSTPVALFVHQQFIERLSEKTIQSAVGERYDILTLLDYVHLHMQSMLDILKDLRIFAKDFALTMDRNFTVQFKIIDFHLNNTWYISVDLSSMKNITRDCVKAFAKFGTLNENEIKNLVNECAPGPSFLRIFIDNVLKYMEVVKKRRAPKTAKP